LDVDGLEHFRRVEHELSLVEAAIGEWANERFPEHPGPAATEVHVRAWLSAHDVRTERLDHLALRRGDLLDRLREFLS
jgi:hypothetical protein